MSKKDKEIKKLIAETHESELRISGLLMTIRSQENQIKEGKDLLAEEKQKYAKLLERYIAMMERVVNLNDQREAERVDKR